MIKPYRKRFTFGLTLHFVFLALTMVTPLFTKVLVDDVIEGGLLEKMMPILIALGVLAVVRGISLYFRDIANQGVSQNIAYDIRSGMYSHLHSLPYRFYDNHRVGEIMSRMTSDLESIRELLANGIKMISENIIYFIGSLIFIFVLSPTIGFVVLATLPLLAFIGLRFDKNIKPVFRKIRELNATLNSKTQENIAGVRVVKAYTNEEFEKKNFHTQNKEHMDTGINIYHVFAKYHPIMEMIASTLPALLLLVGGSLVLNDRLSAGSLLAIFSYLFMIQGPTRNLGNLINTLTQAVASAERIFYYMDFGSYIKEKDDAQFPEEFKGHVVFDHVNFTYGDEEVLTDINIDVPSGNTLAIMGATGSGKTSIVNMLGRFYECYSGAVKIDGIDVKDYRLKELRRNIAYVMQDTFLYSDSLAGNIAFGRPEADDDKIERASKLAQAQEFISNIDNGYDLIVGERGAGLSGGQRQRTAIARALLIEPKILVLDDATSAVDMETEHAIQEGLAEYMKDCTTFVISHRISSVKNADEIIVLDEGRISERGKHDDLLALKGLYYNIFMDQYKDYTTIMNKEVV